MALCFLCPLTVPISQLEQHLRQVHNYSDGEKFRCSEASCIRVYNTFHSFRTHWLSKHDDSNSVVSSAGPSTPAVTFAAKPVVPVNITFSNSLIQDNKDCENSVSGCLSDSVPYLTPKRQAICVTKIRKTLEEAVLEGCSEIISSCSQSQSKLFFNSTKATVISGLNAIREELNTKYNSDPKSSEVLKDVGVMFDTFHGVFKKLDSEHKRIESLKTATKFLEPIEFVVGERSQRVKRTHDGQIQKEKDYATAMLFPLREMLREMFEIPDVYDLAFSYKEKLEKESKVISNFVQSVLWKRSIINFESKQVLPLFLFFDDYETGNPLGSYAGTNKLGGVYISLPCFPPQYQSCLSSILHALLFYSKDREEFGNFAVFRTLLDELKFLETKGIELDLPQGKTTVFFKLGLVIGDNLGLHSLLGFNESFNANYSCRFCKMNKIQRSLATMEDKAFMRTVKSYLRDLQLQDPSRTGIKADCIFHCLRHFHVTKNISVDIMHDLLEGVCLFDLIAILKYYIYETKLFTLEQLNTYMKAHKYGKANSTNIPPPISAQHLKNDNIRMSAAEMSNFFLNLGILIGHLIPRNDSVWQVYLILRQIFGLVSSTSIQEGCSELLNSLVKEHHRLIKTVLKRNLKPKDHLLLHYGTVMAECGPLINLWGMRFESKHQESKNIAALSNSKTNICKSIAKKLQWKFSHQLLKRELFTLTERCGPSQTLIVNDLPIAFASNRYNDVKSLNSTVNVIKWIRKNGSQYNPGMVLCVGETDNQLQFSLIKYIFIDNGVVFFVAQSLNTIFDDHVYAYEVVSESALCSIIAYDNLFSTRPLSLISNSEKRFIVLKSEL